MEITDLLKKESLSLFKTLGAILASIGVIWSTYLEPVVEEYIQEQSKIVYDKDKALIDSLNVKLEVLKDIVDDDYSNNKYSRNKIIEEIQRIYPSTLLKQED